MIITCKTRVLKLEERTRVKSTAKNPDGTVTTERESLGWFITLDTNPVISLCIGPTKPESPIQSIVLKLENHQ